MPLHFPSNLLGFIVKPMMNRLYPPTRLEKRLVMALPAPAQLFGATNQIDSLRIGVRNLSPFKLTVFNVTVDILFAGATISSPTAINIPAQLGRGHEFTFDFRPSDINVLGRQRIAEMRSDWMAAHGYPTDCLGVVVRVHAGMGTFYTEFPASQDLSTIIRIRD